MYEARVRVAAYSIRLLQVLAEDASLSLDSSVLHDVMNVLQCSVEGRLQERLILSFGRSRADRERLPSMRLADSVTDTTDRLNRLCAKR